MCGLSSVNWYDELSVWALEKKNQIYMQWIHDSCSKRREQIYRNWNGAAKEKRKQVKKKNKWNMASEWIKKKTFKLK